MGMARVTLQPANAHAMSCTLGRRVNTLDVPISATAMGSVMMASASASMVSQELPATRKHAPTSVTSMECVTERLAIASATMAGQALTVHVGHVQQIATIGGYVLMVSASVNLDGQDRCANRVRALRVVLLAHAATGSAHARKAMAV